MSLYRIGPIVLDSAAPLPELPRVGRRLQALQWSFRVSRGPAPASGIQWFHEWRFPSGRPWVKLGRAADRYLVRFHRTATFVVDPQHRAVVAYPAAGIPARTVRHLLLDQVVPMLLGDVDHLVIHSSAVAGPAGAVAFVGASGSGKSTLAAALARGGERLITDDCLVVDLDRRPAHVIPTYAGLRLWPDALAALFPGRPRLTAPVAHYSDKRRVTAGPPLEFQAAADPQPLRAACVLGAPAQRRAEARLVALRGHEAFAEILRCTFHLDIARAATAPRALDRVAALLETVPVFRLHLTRDLARIDDATCLVRPLIAA